MQSRSTEVGTGGRKTETPIAIGKRDSRRDDFFQDNVKVNDKIKYYGCSGIVLKDYGNGIYMVGSEASSGKGSWFADLICDDELMLLGDVIHHKELEMHEISKIYDRISRTIRGGVMDSLYGRNGLMFWGQNEIRIRNMMVDDFVFYVSAGLKKMNKAFDVMQVEAPVLTPTEFINTNYSATDYYSCGYGLSLRPETTMGSYQYAKWIMEHTENKVKLPICIWQHGKSFRIEQDQPASKMKLKEFYQLEFQCIYGLTTANDYSEKMIPIVNDMISSFIGPCRIEQSDRLPDYSEKTADIVCEKSGMEVCSISIRKDFPNAKVLEIAIGTDRCVYNHLEK